MSHRLLFLIAIVLSVCPNTNIKAQMLKDSVLINFRQSKVNLDTAYMGNAHALDHARRTIKYYHQPDSNFVLTHVDVVGGASPEGSVRFNEWLSEKRAERIFNYFGERFVLPDSLTTFTFLGRDWAGLRRMVTDDPNVPYRADVLSTIDEIIKLNRETGTETNDNIQRIKHLHGGVPYLYMYRNLFPTLRASKLVLTFDNLRPRIRQILVMPVTPLTFDPDLVNPPAELLSIVLPARKPFYMALKSNMLFDLLAIPELGAEFYLGKDFSVVGNWMYGWWDTDRTHRYWRLYGGDLAFRWWFGQKAHEKPLTGHHLGVYGGVVTYDFEWGGRGYMGGRPGHSLWAQCNWYAGVEYGYSLPIAKRINIDFTIGFGYLEGKYRVYDPVDRCYVWKETRTRHWYGPTKAEVSLVWLIGHGNYNRNK